MGRHELDPLIHVHRSEERMIERNLAQGEAVASSERRAKRRMVAFERRPSARHIYSACRPRRLWRLPLIHAVAHALFHRIRQRSARMRLGGQPRSSGVERIDDATAKDAFDEGQMFENFGGRPAIRRRPLPLHVRRNRVDGSAKRAARLVQPG